MTIQATGDIVAAEQLLETRGVIRPDLQQVLNRLGHISIDIQPRFVAIDSLNRPNP